MALDAFEPVFYRKMHRSFYFVEIGANDGPRLTLITLSDDPNEFLINWYGQAGTLTVTSLDTQVPVGDGSVSTKGATGSIEAEVAAGQHGSVHVSGTWACHMPF